MVNVLRSRRLHLYTLGFCLVFCHSLIFNRAVLPLELGGAVESALANSYDLKRLQGKIIASRYAVDERWGYFSPSLEVGLYRSEMERYSRSQTNTKTDDYSIILSQPIYNPSLWSNYQEAIVTGELTEIQHREARDKLVFDTLMAVLTICRLRSRLAVTDSSLKSVNQSLEIQKKRLKADFGTRFDLLETEAEVYRYRKERQEVASRLKSELLKFGQLTGQPWQEDQFPILTGFSDLTSDIPFDQESQHWTDLAFQNNTQLQAVFLNQKTGRIQQERSSNTFKPELDLIFTHNQTESKSTITSRVMDNTVKFNISMGFSPVAGYYRLRRFDSEMKALMQEEEKVKKDIINKIISLVHSLKMKHRDLETQRQWMAKQEEIGRLYEKGLERRHFPATQVLEASRKRNDSQLGSVGTVIEIWETRINLLYLTGQLNEVFIDLLDQVF